MNILNNSAYGFGKTGELSNEQLQRVAPSIFADSRAMNITTDRYVHIPTIKVVEAMRKEGLVPTKATETRVRDENRKGYAKHMIRFRHVDDLTRPAIVGDTVPEIILLNSHDGKSSYQLHAGMFRFVCANGMIVGESLLDTVKIRHKGDIVDDVIEGTYRVIDEVPAIAERVREYNGIQLNAREQHALASAAIALRWDGEQSPVEPDQLLRARRTDDKKDDLWTTFNRVQENMIKGGLLGRAKNGRARRTREVKAVDANSKLNKALWVLADELADIKTAA